LRNDIGESSFLVLAIALSIPNLISIAGILVLSNLTDKKGRFRETILLINIVGTIEYMLLTQIVQVTEYMLIIGIGALVFPAYYTLIQAFATNICKDNERGKVTSYLMLFASVGWFMGSIVSGPMFRILGMNFMFVISSIIFFLTGLIILKAPKFMPNSSNNNNEEEVSRVSIVGIIKRKQVFLILLTAIIVDVSAGAMFMMGSIYAFEHIGLNPDQIGYSAAIATAVATILLLQLGKLSDKYGRRPQYVFGLSLYPIWYGLLFIFPDPFIFFIIWSLPVYAFLRPILPAMISDLTIEAERSRGMALISIASTGSMTIGAILLGFIVDITGNIDLWITVPAIFGWFAVVIGYFFVKETLVNKS
jgi:MFS family permease